MKVIVAGGYGCGTTHVYRIVKAVLELRGIEHTARGISDSDLRKEFLLYRKGWYVLKTHDACASRRAGSLKVLLCVRDLFDAAASHLRRSNKHAVLSGVCQRGCIERVYTAPGRHDVTTIDYESLYPHPERKVRLVAGCIGFSLSDVEVESIAIETGLETTRIKVRSLTDADPVSELRPDHIGVNDGRPGAGAMLSPRLRDEIRRWYGNA